MRSSGSRRLSRPNMLEFLRPEGGVTLAADWLARPRRGRNHGASARHEATVQKQLNYRFLLGLTAAALLTGTAVAAVHAWQVRGQAASLLAEAGRAEESAAPDRAAEYLKRYLAYAPDNVDALERYGRLLERLARTTADRERALFVYEEALMREPERRSVRRAAVDLAMKQGDFVRAQQHLEIAAPLPPRRRRTGGPRWPV